MPAPPPSRAQLLTESSALALGLLLMLALASRGVGVTWDESTYIRYCDRVLEWLSAPAMLAPETIQRHWNVSSYLNPHPPFMKILDAITAASLGDLVEYPLRYRLGHQIYFALCLALVYAVLRRAWGLPATLMAVAGVLLQPRVFGELLIATTDGPVALAWLLLALLAWRLDAERARASRRWLRALFFLFYGFAVATKFTGLLVALPLAVYYLVRRNRGELLWLGGAVVWALAFMVLVSPHHWHDPLRGAVEFLTYPFTRPSIPIATFYLGSTYEYYLPWHHFLVMSLSTFPVPILLCLAGVPASPVQLRPALWPLAFCLGFWIVLMHLPATPKHDGVRQFVSVFPMLGVVAAAGLCGLCERLRARVRPAWALALPPVVGAMLAASLFMNHPRELSYYNPAIGGIRGAERAGMELSYYLESIDPAFVAAVNRELKAGDTVYVLPDWPLLMGLYQREWLLRRDIRIGSPGTPGRPDYLIVVRRRASIDDAWYLGLEAIHETRYDGVSLAKLARVPPPPVAP